MTLPLVLTQARSFFVRGDFCACLLRRLACSGAKRAELYTDGEGGSRLRASETESAAPEMTSHIAYSSNRSLTFHYEVLLLVLLPPLPLLQLVLTLPPASEGAGRVRLAGRQQRGGDARQAPLLVVQHSAQAEGGRSCLLSWHSRCSWCRPCHCRCCRCCRCCRRRRCRPRCRHRCGRHPCCPARCSNNPTLRFLADSGAAPPGGLRQAQEQRASLEGGGELGAAVPGRSGADQVPCRRREAEPRARAEDRGVRGGARAGAAQLGRCAGEGPEELRGDEQEGEGAAAR